MRRELERLGVDHEGLARRQHGRCDARERRGSLERGSLEMESDLRKNRVAVVVEERLPIHHRVGGLIDRQVIAEIELRDVTVGSSRLAEVIRRERKETGGLVEVVAGGRALDWSQVLRGSARRRREHAPQNQRGNSESRHHVGLGVPPPRRGERRNRVSLTPHRPSDTMVLQRVPTARPGSRSAGTNLSSRRRPRWTRSEPSPVERPRVRSGSRRLGGPCRRWRTTIRHRPADWGTCASARTPGPW